MRWTASTRPVLSISVLTAAALFAGCAHSSGEAVVAPRPSTRPSIVTTTSASAHPKATRPVEDPPVPAALYAPGLDIRARPVPVPLQLRIPSIAVDAQVLGVGVTTADVMDAPEGPAHDPVWGEAFWYREVQSRASSAPR